jgi:hypothetical protein
LRDLHQCKRPSCEIRRAGGRWQGYKAATGARARDSARRSVWALRGRVGGYLVCSGSQAQAVSARRIGIVPAHRMGIASRRPQEPSTENGFRNRRLRLRKGRGRRCAHGTGQAARTRLCGPAMADMHEKRRRLVELKLEEGVQQARWVPQAANPYRDPRVIHVAAVARATSPTRHPCLRGPVRPSPRVHVDKVADSGPPVRRARQSPLGRALTRRRVAKSCPTGENPAQPMQESVSEERPCAGSAME